MALVLKDRVKQTASNPGTGTITLLTTPTGFQSFSAVGNGNTTYFAIVDSASGDWEVNYGTYTSSGTTLSRSASPLSSSAGGALVNFTGTVDVFVTYPSEKAVWQDTSGVVAQQSFGAITATSAGLTTGTVSATPSSDTDIANKQYVDTVAAEGIHYHEAVFVESPNTAGNLTATYTSGGTNSNIIQIDNGTDITFFGYTPVVGDQFLTTAGNGLLANTPYYIVALVGSACQISLSFGGTVITGLTNGSPTLPSLINPGVGATLTNAGTKAALTIDGELMTVGKRVLIYNQTNGFENGVYTVTTVGTPDPGGTNWVLTRATDADTYAPSRSDTLGQGDAFFVTAGDTGAGETYVVTTNGDIFFGITTISFAQISSAQVYSAGTGLNLSPATTFNISNTGVSANTYGSASIVPVFAVNAQGQLTSVTNTNIAINGSAVSGNISGAAGSVTNSLTAGTYLTGTAFNGSAAQTWTVDATSANTASKVVARDSSGNFSAGTITATLSGAATSSTTATNLAGGAANQIPYQTAAGTTAFATAASGTNTVLNFTGSGFSWVAGTISGVALGSNLNALTLGTYLTGTSYNGSSTVTAAVDATSANTASKVVARDASGNFSAGTITATLSGSATSATTATTATQVSNSLTLATSGTGLSGSASFNGASAQTFTVTSNATSANTASTIVARDSSGNFTAGTITAALSGNATTATSATSASNSTTTSQTNFSNLTIGSSQVLYAGNYNSYAPTLGGTGASGTWGISISGNAATATSATSATSATTATTATTANATNTSNNFQMNSLGVGTAGSGTAGEIRATNNVTAYYSDDRLKTRLGNIEGALDKVKTLDTFYYEANETAQALGYKAIREVGISAQQVQTIMPETVAPAPIDDQYLTVRYERLVPLLLAAIKELEAKVALLEAKG
jgi:hypothetical protein